MAQVNDLKKKIDSGFEVSFSNYHPHTMANVLKIYFKELPEPVFSSKLGEAFLTSKEAPNRINALKDLLKKLPEPNQIILKKVFYLFSVITSYSALNNVNSSNISKEYSSVFFKQIEKSPSALNSSRNLIEFMIHNYKEIF